MVPDDRPASSKPTPVREALPGDGRRPDMEYESRVLETDDGARVRVEELGWGRSGRREDPGVPLVLLGFRPEDQKDFTHEAVVPAAGLTELSEAQLLAALASARPFQGVPRDRPFFGGTNNRRSRESRGRRGRPSSG